MSSADFSITDMYQIVADGRAVHTLSPNIVIVDVNNCTRDQIAETIELTKLCEPKAIGVDVSFVEQREGDEPLVQSFANADNIVCAELLETSKSNGDASQFDVKYRSWFADSLGSGVTFAAANFPTIGHGGTMRNFKPWFNMTDGKETPSFATALAMKADPESVKRLRLRGNDTEAIYYPSVEFKVLMPGELYDRGRRTHRQRSAIRGTQRPWRSAPHTARFPHLRHPDTGICAQHGAQRSLSRTITIMGG